MIDLGDKLSRDLFSARERAAIRYMARREVQRVKTVERVVLLLVSSGALHEVVDEVLAENGVI